MGSNPGSQFNIEHLTNFYPLTDIGILTALADADKGGCREKARRKSAAQVMATGAWYWAARTDEAQPLEVHGDPNVLTRDVGTPSLGQGQTAHSCLVEMELLDGALPANLAFDPIPSLTTSGEAGRQVAPLKGEYGSDRHPLARAGRDRPEDPVTRAFLG